MKYIKPISLGSLKLLSNIFYSPLAGCSDFPFRDMCNHKDRPGLFYCEMVKMDALVRHDENTYRLLDYSTDMHPIGAQLCGSKPAYAKEASKIIEELGFDVLDLNCGCPVDKVTKDGSGSGLLKTPDLVGEILHEMVSAVSIPVTVKIRAGWDEDSIIVKEITQIAEKAGAKAITVHGRTRVQAYKGNANWDYIKEAKEAADTIKVIGNGDIFDPDSAQNIFEYTNCDGILVSRGTMGKPWISKAIMESLDSSNQILRDGLFHKQILLEHLKSIKAYQNEHRAIVNMRRVGCWYLRNGQGTKRLREAINKASSLSEMHSLIESYSWEETQYE